MRYVLLYLVEHDGSIWVKWISSHPELHPIIQSEEFANLVCDRLYSWNDIEGRSNAFRLLLSLGNLGHTTSEVIWKRCSDIIHSIDIKKYVEIDARDVAIYNTPEGTLFNQQVIDDNSDYAADAKNVKRESKTYKYKDQLAELQLRKELAEKNRREGKLTDKQQKAVAAELQIEQVILTLVLNCVDIAF